MQLLRIDIAEKEDAEDIKSDIYHIKHNINSFARNYINHPHVNIDIMNATIKRLFDEEIITSDFLKQIVLEREYRRYKLGILDAYYTSNLTPSFKKTFMPKIHQVYQFNDKKYIRVESDCASTFVFNDGTKNPNDFLWIEVSPIKWYYDENSMRLVAKDLLVSGISRLDSFVF